jgi:hypothetical protein
MKATFKPLGLAAAVAAVTAGYAGVTQAQTALANNSLGDVAVVPYYTTQDDFVTGVHILNTSNLTQVVKLRLRRATDSMDSMDFNIILSPYDEWTGFVDDSSGKVVMATEDTSCTAPLRADGRFEMPGLYAAGGNEGYMEVIGMGSAAANTPIAVGAKHTSAGVPFDCASVESNFFRNATLAPLAYDATGDKGIRSSSASSQACTDAIALATGAIGFGKSCASDGIAVLENNYLDTGDVLKVSFFHRDAASGLEFGNSAVHLKGFSRLAMMSNQEEVIVGSTDAFGYYFPDLDGGSPIDTPRDKFTEVRAALGATSVINDWSVASARNVATNWVITLPGQYIMLDLAQYTLSLFDEDVKCLTKEQADALPAPFVPAEEYCDFRDLPVGLSIDVWNREEGTFSSPDGGLVISPATSFAPDQDTLENEVNVIQWTDGSSPVVLPSGVAKQYDVSALGAEFGWAELSVSSAPNKTQGIYNFLQSGATGLPTFDSVVNPVPIVGFVAWERSFPSDPSANYGRIVEHSYGS